MQALIRGGRPAQDCSLMFPSQLVEVLGHAGFDWVSLDCEHGSLFGADLEIMAMAADAVGITRIGRPRSNSAADIQSVLDLGVAGVQIPHIDTAADAIRAVAAVKFGPGAGRGLAAGTLPDRWGLGAKMPDFVEQANAGSPVCVQRESADAIVNAREALTAPGIDVFFIGPSDLSGSMGHPGNPKAPTVAHAIAETLTLIREAGQAPGMPAIAENLPEVLASECLYIHTHPPRLPGATAEGPADCVING